MLAFQDVVVVPFSDLLTAGPGGYCHRGGPLWPDFYDQHEARHQRRGEPVDHEPEPQPASSRLQGRWAWAGPISQHFGHQIVEFSMRLMPTLACDPTARFLFGAPLGRRVTSIGDAPPFFREILRWFGIDPERCHMVTAPLVVDELVVAPQAEQLGGGVAPTAGHLDAMDAITEERLGKASQRGTVYVSRAGMSARFAGEAVIEEGLIRCGVRVVRPEALSLDDQLRTYASARQLIFAEGSAVYGSLLLGRALANVVVLQRRSGFTLGRPALRPRSTTLAYRDAIAHTIPGRTWQGAPTDAKAMSVLDEGALLDIFDELEIPIRDHWDHQLYLEACERDVRAHLDSLPG